MSARSVVSTLVLLVFVISVGYWLLERPELGSSKPQHVVGGGRESSSGTGPEPSVESSPEIQVRVVDAFGVPLEGAVVRPVGSSGASETGPDGLAAIAASSDGPIRIESEHPRWGRVEVEARPSEGGESHEIRYAATGVLDVAIQMRGAEPLNEIWVDRLPTEFDPETRSIEVEPFDGDTVKSLRVERVPPGRIELVGFGAHGFAFGTIQVDVERNGEEHEVVLRIARIDGHNGRTVVHGVVSLDGSRLPREPVSISVVGPGGSQSSETRTDDAGRFEIKVVGLVHGCTIIGALTRLSSTADGVVVPVDIEETPSEFEVDLSFTRRRPGSRGVLLVAGNGDPLPGLVVEADMDRPDSVVPLCTNDEGVLATEGFPVERFDFVAVFHTYHTQGRWEQLRIPFELDPRSGDGPERVVLPVQVTLLEASIDLDEREALDVEVSYSVGRTRVRSQFRSTQSPFPLAHTVDVGSLEVTGAIVEASREDPRIFFDPDGVPTVTRSLLRVERPIDCSVPPRVCELRPGRALNLVFVVDAQGRPVPGATLHLDPKQLHSAGQKSEDGAWFISKAWSFDVIERDRYWFLPDLSFLPETLWVYASSAGIAEVRRDDIVDGVTITLETDRCLVVDTAESSLEYSEFLLRYESGEVVIGPIGFERPRDRFFVPLLPEGTPALLELSEWKNLGDGLLVSGETKEIVVPPGARRVVAP